VSKSARRRSMARERYHLQREGWGWNTFALPEAEAEAVETATLERCQTTGRWVSRALAAPWPKDRSP